MVFCLYVDDLIYFGTNEDIVKMFKKNMMNEFEMINLGMMKYFLGLKLRKARDKFFFHNKNMLKICLKGFIWTNANQ